MTVVSLKDHFYKVNLMKEFLKHRIYFQQKIFIFIFLFTVLPLMASEKVSYHEGIQGLNESMDMVLPLFTQRESYQSRIDLALHPENKQLDVLTFTLAEDSVGFSLLAAAVEIAEKGGAPRIGFDAFSSKVSSELVTYMREKGVELRAYRPLSYNFKNMLYFLKLGPFGFINYLNMRTHDKVFITKHGVIVGSSNYSKYYYLLGKKEIPEKKERWEAWTFLDREILIQGPAEYEARREFEKKWNEIEFWSTGETVNLTNDVRKKFDEAILKQKVFLNEVKNSKKLNDLVSVQDLEYVNDTSSFIKKNNKIHKKILELISSAQHEIIISNPYVLLPKDNYEALISAKNRGVRIKIFTNKAGGSDEGDVSKQFKFDLRKLENSGFEVYLNEFFYVFHGKVIVVDNESIYWGSYNFDNRSKRFNSENGVFFKSIEIAKLIYDRTLKNGIFRGVEIIGKGEKKYNLRYLPQTCREYYSKPMIETILLPRGFWEKIMMKVKEPLL